MSTPLGSNAVTWLDIMKGMDSKGMPLKVAEILNQRNEMFQYMKVRQCNNGTKHEFGIRTGLPVAAWRRYNQGTQPTKATLVQATATTGMLTANSPVDAKLLERDPGYRQRQAASFIEVMGQTAASAFIYDDERTNPTRITGLAAHYATMVEATAASGANVIGGSGVGSDNMSMYLVDFSDNGVYGIVPEGSLSGGGSVTGGIKHTGMGPIDIADDTGIAGSTFVGYRDYFEMDLGLVVENWTHGGRICNIDKSNLVAQSSNANLPDLMVRLEERVINGPGDYVWLMNRVGRTCLRRQSITQSGYQTTFDTVGGKRVMAFNGIPIATVDALVNSEATVV